MRLPFQKLLGKFRSNKVVYDTCQHAWVDANPSKRAQVLTWSVNEIFEIVGKSSLQGMADTLQIEFTHDRKALTEIIRRVIIEWLNYHSAQRSSDTIIGAINKLAERFLCTRRDQEAENIRSIKTATRHLQNDTEQMLLAKENLKSAQTQEERDEAFNKLMRTMAGESG